MTERAKLLQSIAATTADYREGDLAAPTPEHVERWVRQFGDDVQLPMLREMDHVLKRTYFSRKQTEGFLADLFRTEKLVGNDPCAFWKGVKFLDIQGGGASQKEMLALFSKVLKTKCGFEVTACGAEPEYVYIDDAMFTGNRIKQDIENWIAADAPERATVHIIIVIALHTGAKYYVEHHGRGNILRAARDAQKQICFRWWRKLALENQRVNADSSDVLWPVHIPDDEEVKGYVDGMMHRPHLRIPGQIGGNSIFSNDEGRQLLEQEFLNAGIRIRMTSPHLNKYQRPLGNMLLETLGFGSLIVTFRNCPNNAPLALWAGEPWYPLFSRTTNSDTSLKAMLAKDL